MPDFLYEEKLGRGAGTVIAGLDEVGRGPLAGPVVAAAVIWPAEIQSPALLADIKDSKKLSAKQREKLAAFIKAESIWCVQHASVEEIDSLNILQASLLAMQRAAAGLTLSPHHLLIDGNQKIKTLSLPQTTVIGGDGLSLSIAAAAIIAKVQRDHMMAELDALYPGYGWASNAGYGSALHMEALKTLGPTPHHRASFAPVAAALAQQRAA